MLKRRFDGKTIGTLFIMIMSVCLSAYASLRSADAWTLNPSDFRYDMTLYFSMAQKGYENLEAYEIGAFINDECRGLAENLELPEGESCMYMRIRSNNDEAEEVVFKMREKATGKITILESKDAADFLFKPNEMVGLPSDPYILMPYYHVSIVAGDNGSVDFTDGMYAEGSVIEVEAIPAEGYHFEKWSDGVTEAKRSITVDADIELTATFAVTSYKAVFSIDGTEIATLDVNYGSKIEAPAAPEKEGYTFNGWTDLPETMPAKNLEITGTYTVNSYKVSFMIDGTLIEELEVAFGGEIVAPAAPEKEGYTFNGWSAIPSVMPAGNVEITGSYTVNSYKLTFKLDDTVIEEKEVAFGSEIKAPEVPEKEGYTFSGWEGLPQTMPAKDLELTGTYTVNYYKLTFVIDDEIIEEKEVAFGSEIVAPATPDKEGHSFEGWLNFVSTMPAEDVTIFGSYKVNSHLLIYMVDGEIFEEHVVAYGAKIEAPEGPEKKGYTFAGWEGLPETMPAKDLEVIGTYTVNSYKAVFTIDGEVVATLDVEYGAKIEAPEAPEKEGYYFEGWAALPETMPAEDIEITGSYAVNYYKLTVYIDGEIYMAETLAYGDEIIIPEPVPAENMKFEGWTEEVPATMPAHDLVINGTMVPDESTSVIGIMFDKDEVVSIYNLNGVLLHKDVKANEVKELLAPGLYIINGKKVMVK